MRTWQWKKTGKILAAALLALLLTGCAAVPFPPAPDPAGPGGYRDGVIGENKNSGKDSLSGWGPGAAAEDGILAPDSAFMPAPAGKADAYYGGEVVPPGMPAYEGEMPIPGPGVQSRAGTLSASEQRDTADLADFQARWQQASWKTEAKERGLYAGNVIPVIVSSGNGKAYGVTVTLKAGGKEIYRAVTDIQGRAFLCYPDDAGTQFEISAGSQTRTVTVSEREGTISTQFKEETLRYYGCDPVTFEQEGKKAAQLDLMLMIDTTGSMGDELEYLKVELKDIVERVQSFNEKFSIRVSVNFYRDEGDDYVVKYYDFRESVDECLNFLAAERATGGGDYPEAVHTALENAVNGHVWREDAVKLCFMVLDAPPHTEREVQSVNSVILKALKDAAAQGIRLIPVVCSGSNMDLQVLMRGGAVMTGGTYLYLTNDSGIGYSHEIPDAPQSDVEALNECMIRVISEYCGLPYEPVPYIVPDRPTQAPRPWIDPTVPEPGPAEYPTYYGMEE
ncbi:MAG: VWA domain-containing protein [Lachnospiraceae bacterium]|nr:VWA domain-containing protein [Lachnospiraceae bacterium]